MTTDREKMQAGHLYMPCDPELTQDRRNARDILKTINSQENDDYFVKEEFFRELFADLGGNPRIERVFHCDYGYNIHIGHNFYANYDCVILDCAEVTIGDDVLFGPGVHVYTAQHPLDPEQRKTGVEYASPVRIGNNVWVGGGAIINPGVTVGDNVVIGSGSVVTKDVPDNTVVAGNPACIIRQLP